MTTRDIGAILDDAVAAAGKYHWDRLRDFAAGLPGDHDPTVLLLTSADTEPGPLARWIGSVPPSVPVRAESLEALAGHPGTEPAGQPGHRRVPLWRAAHPGGGRIRRPGRQPPGRHLPDRDGGRGADPQRG